MSKQKILIVDDEEAIRHALTRMLRPLEVETATASNGEEALEAFREHQPDIVLLDVVMPKKNGFEVCQELKSRAESRLVPVVIVTSSSAPENKLRGLEVGADDFIAKPFDRSELTARVRSLLRIKSYTDELERAETVLFALARSIEGKDPYTEGHCERLSLFAQKLALRLGLPDEEIAALVRAGVVHDVGKVAVPDAILLKQGPLDEAEWKVMREHPVVGERICSGMKTFRLVLPIIRHHHERLDGSGYPDRLAGDAIPRTARILSIVDVFDALTTSRPYRAALPLEKALGIMQEEVGKGWWDPEIFAAFAALVREEGFELPAEETRERVRAAVGAG
jgi:putative two-component system response regulator